jgi:hypothetical protein
VDPVPDPILLRKSGSSGNRTSESVARNSGHKTTEAEDVSTLPKKCLSLYGISSER